MFNSWELTGKYLFDKRFGKVTVKVQERKPMEYGQSWDYRWRWATFEDMFEVERVANKHNPKA